ncbi:hypothetical protein Acr_07g0007520 [Actinidia rufa]|uniref:Uncharacterized protein n=1 Tax=Actinidia rufa TaxID=165716 RepID=A0A7J0EVS4_9ERIC|nr:hypothetical protein Acr_07g0007520 [Actinidia rufa]
MADKNVAKLYPDTEQSGAEAGWRSKSKGDTVIPSPKKSVKRMMVEFFKYSANKYRNKPKVSPGAAAA